MTTQNAHLVEQIRDTFKTQQQEFLNNFAEALATLDGAGVDMTGDKGAAALGMTPAAYRQTALNAAVACWRDGFGILDQNSTTPTSPDSMDELEFYAFVVQNLMPHQILKMAGIALPVGEIAGMLGKTVEAFKDECKVTAKGGFYFINTHIDKRNPDSIDDMAWSIPLYNELSGYAPDDNFGYQQVGFASKIAFETHVIAWQAGTPPQNDTPDCDPCCGNGCHAPAPGSCGPN